MTDPEKKMTDLEKEIFGDFFSIDSPSIKSYATKENLLKALAKHGATRHYGKPFAVLNSAGRWTAIIDARSLGGNLTSFPGFMKM